MEIKREEDKKGTQEENAREQRHRGGPVLATNRFLLGVAGAWGVLTRPSQGRLEGGDQKIPGWEDWGWGGRTEEGLGIADSLGPETPAHKGTMLSHFTGQQTEGLRLPKLPKDNGQWVVAPQWRHPLRLQSPQPALATSSGRPALSVCLRNTPAAALGTPASLG